MLATVHAMHKHRVTLVVTVQLLTAARRLLVVALNLFHLNGEFEPRFFVITILHARSARTQPVRPPQQAT